MGGLGAIVGILFSVIIGLAVGLVGVVLRLFVGHIIVFDSIALGVIAGL